jgi:hypothetical protein
VLGPSAIDGTGVINRLPRLPAKRNVPRLRRRGRRRPQRDGIQGEGIGPGTRPWGLRPGSSRLPRRLLRRTLSRGWFRRKRCHLRGFLQRGFPLGTLPWRRRRLRDGLPKGKFLSSGLRCGRLRRGGFRRGGFRRGRLRRGRLRRGRLRRGRLRRGRLRRGRYFGTLLRRLLGGRRLAVFFVGLRRLYGRRRRSASRPCRSNVRLIPSVRRVRCAAVVGLARHLTDRTDPRGIQRTASKIKRKLAVPTPRTSHRRCGPHPGPRGGNLGLRGP